VRIERYQPVSASKKNTAGYVRSWFEIGLKDQCPDPVRDCEEPADFVLPTPLPRG